MSNGERSSGQNRSRGEDKGQSSRGEGRRKRGRHGDERRGSRRNDERRGSRRNDERRGSRRNDERRGSRGNDEHRGSRGNDERRGLRGNDERRGLRGNDERRGSRGNDERRGSRGNDERRGPRRENLGRGNRSHGDGQAAKRIFQVSPARRVAFQALHSLFEEDAFLQPALSALAAEAQLSNNDRRLAWELVLGVSRQWGALVAHLDELLSQGSESLPPEVLRALVLGAYQLVHLDRIPAYAAVNESVTLAKESDQKFTGVTNKVLKLIMENGLPELSKLKGLQKLAAELSHPEWWVKAQVKKRGMEQTKRIATANNSAAPLSIRFSPKIDSKAVYDRLIEEGAQLTPLKWAEGGFDLKVSRPFTLPSQRDRWWYVQDEASQLVAQLLEPELGDLVWDVCAAPGGKSLTLLEMIGEEGQLLSTDLHERKTRELAGRLSIFANATVCQHDGSKGAPDGYKYFDKILLDAPCSALGVIRRHPEIRWRRSVNDVKKAAKKQRKLLESVALHLKVGGSMVYSVCTDTKEETTEVINDFLLAFPDFSIGSPSSKPVWEELYNDALDLNPADHGSDSFYAVKLIRTR